MEFNDQSKKIIVSFNYESIEIIDIQCDINDKFETIINELSMKLNIEKTSLFFLYDGRILNSGNFDEKISSIINSNDKKIKKINMLAYRKEHELEKDILQSKNINILLIIDSHDVKKAQGKMSETLKEIIQKENSNIISEIDKFKFIYKNKKIDLDKKFEEIADDYDKKIYGMTINVNHIEKVIVNFVIDKTQEKRILCLPQEKIEDVIIKNIAPMSIYVLNIKQYFNSYFFKYKNKEIELKKTIEELYNDKSEESLQKKSLSDSISEVTSPIANTNELKEIKIEIITKTCCQRYKCLFLIISIFTLIIIIALIVLIITKPGSK